MDPREELQALRRLAELEAKAKGKPDFSNVQAPRGGSTEEDYSPTKRDILLGGRAALEGVAGIPDLVGSPLKYLLEKTVGPQTSFTDMASGLADKMGLPRANNAGERVRSDVARAMSGGAVTMGAGGAMAGLPGAAGRLGTALSSQPALQTVSNATGAAASGITRESGGGQGAQLAAGLIGGLAPSGAVGGAQATVRGALRGGEAGRRALSQNVDDFARAGSTPTVGQGANNLRSRLTEAVLRNAPGGSGVVRRRLEQQGDELGAGVDAAASRLSTAQGAERGGNAVIRGITGPSGFMARFKAESSRLYDDVQRLLPPETRAKASSTMSILDELTAPIRGAENISLHLRDPKIAGIADSFAADIAAPTPARSALNQAEDSLSGLYASRDAATQEAGKFAAQANQQANAAHNFAPVPGFPRVPGRYAPHVQRADEAASAAQDAASLSRERLGLAQQLEAQLGPMREEAARQGGTLPFEAMKQLRSRIGELIGDSALAPDGATRQLRRLYGAMSDDLSQAAIATGDKRVIQAASRANAYYRAGMQRVDDIERVVDRSGGPEAVYKALFNNSREGGTTLRKVMQSLDGQAQRDLAATTLRRLGKANPSAQDELGEVFSPETYLTNWSRMAPEAKRALFDRFGPGFSKDLDAIAASAARIRGANQTLPNPSGSAVVAGQTTAFGALAYGAMTMNPTAIGGAAGGLALANLGARALTNPRAVKWLAQTTRMPAAALPSQVAILASMAKEDPELAELYQQVTGTGE